jgi:hypothetical protein
MAHGVIYQPTVICSAKPIRSIPRHNDESDEWSDAGRDPRFVAGWWIIPGLLLAIMEMLIVLFIAIR